MPRSRDGGRYRHHVYVMAVAIVSLLVSALPAAASSRSAPANTFNEPVKNYWSHQCLDVVNHGTSNGDHVQQWFCSNPLSQNQHWVFNAVTTWDGYQVYQIKEYGTNECLEAPNWETGDRTPVDIWTCEYGNTGYPDSNQQWALLPPGFTSSYGSELANVNASNVRNKWVLLDLECDANTQNGLHPGAPVQLYQVSNSSCDGGQNQTWLI